MKSKFITGDLDLKYIWLSSKKEKTADLTPQEFELLKFMFKNQNKVLTREILLGKIWKYEYTGDTRTADVIYLSVEKENR